MKTIKILIAAVFLVLISIVSFGQQVNQQIETIREKYIDSIKNSTWPYVLPIWGKKIVKRGVDLQYPFGVMVNYLAASQKVNISDLEVGINNSPMVPLNFVKFGEVKADVQTLNARIDVWTIPFIDFYGIFGKTWASTNVNLIEPFNFSTVAKFNGGVLGAGVTLGGAYHRVFATLDYNNTWASFDQIQSAVHSQMLAPRFGYTFPFKNKPWMNFAPWIGFSGFFVNHGTVGSINLNDLKSSTDESNLDGAINGTSDWYQNLTPAQKVVVKQIAQKIKDQINGNNVDGVTINYSLKKRPTSTWSMTAGGQFQLNHRLQFRTEAGFLGGKKSILTSVNYRFGLK
jgi:hypothetical protein